MEISIVALCEGDAGGMGMTLYDLRQQLDVFPPTLGFSTTSLVFVLLWSSDCFEVSLTFRCYNCDLLSKHQLGLVC